MNRSLPNLEHISSHFDILGDFVSGTPYGTGHINETYALTFNQGGNSIRYLFQKLNTNIFKNPKGLMENIVQVTQHLRNKLSASGLGEASRRTLTLLPTRRQSGRESLPYFDDPELGFWRAYIFIEGARTYDILEHRDQAYEAAKAFGEFQAHLADYAGPRLTETIPLFHHTPSRLKTFQEAVKQDPLGRAKEVQKEIDFVLSRGYLAKTLTDLQESGEIPERITHNDTKLNNVMLDTELGEGICVIDLDTVMPGLSLYDFGDMVRTACNPVAEDAPDVDKVIAREDMFMALAEGYLKGTRGALRPIEIENLAVAGMLLTYECGMRFLTDYLVGDTYFKIHRKSHNLDRCRTQFALVRSLEAKQDSLMKSVQAMV